MNPLHTVLALQAARNRRAVPKTLRRHVHLSARPFVVAGYHLAGDPGAPLALVWGVGPSQSRCMVVPEPRDRALRFEALAVFAADLVGYLADFGERDETGMCLDAPQLIAPNAATVDWLSAIVGRFTRNLPQDGDKPAPPLVPLAGKHLSFLGDVMPGSSLSLAATDALSTHFQTGQLPSEDLNLAALLGWIDPPDGMDGPEAAHAGELRPPAGPESDPAWDANSLTKLVAESRASSGAAAAAVRDELEDEVREQLDPAWADCWRALDILDTLPVADHVASRWQTDVASWTRHRTAISDGTARFRNVPTPVQAAARLKVLESRTDDLEREMAWDDELVMAAALASGEALCGVVTDVDAERRTRSANGRAVRRPLMSIEPALDFARPVGTTLFLASEPGVQVAVLPAPSGGPVQVEVVKGANQTSTLGRLPVAGERVVLSSYGQPEMYTRHRVEDIPWTHQHAVDGDLRRP